MRKNELNTFVFIAGTASTTSSWGVGPYTDDGTNGPTPRTAIN